MSVFDSTTRSTVVCAVTAKVNSQGGRSLGFAAFDSVKRALRVCEYKEDHHLSTTEALLLQIQPSDVCFALQDPATIKKLNGVAESCGAPLKQVKSAEYSRANVEQDLQRLLKGASGPTGLSKHLEILEKDLAMNALAVLIASQSLMSDSDLFGKCSLTFYPLQDFVHLDKAAFSALNILPAQDQGMRAPTSILGFLNKCKTGMGTRRLTQWLTQPLCNAEEITNRHNLVQILSSSPELLQKVEENFRHVPDLEKISSKFFRSQANSKAGNKANLDDIVFLYRCVKSSHVLAAALSSYQGECKDTLQRFVTNPLQKCLNDMVNVVSLVDQTLDLSEIDNHGKALISKNFDKSLLQLAEKRDALKEKLEVLRKQVDSLLALPKEGKNSAGVSITEGTNGLCFRVTKKSQSTVQNSKKLQVKVVQIKKQEFLFTTTEFEQAVKQWEESTRHYEEQQAQLVDKAIAVVSTFVPVMDRMAELLGRLDVLAAFARVVLTAPCNFVRPNLDLSGEKFDLKGMTHVLVAVNSEKSFIANDLCMDHETSRLQLITGPNMGGKSTHIRAAALVAIFNQIGCFVPCQEATLPIFNSIMCRVGASDMQLRGISTFMAEMLEAACILNTANEKSLVIIDELGRGTSTQDGFGLAWAIAQHIVEETKCFCLFATHFHEMAALQEKASGVKNFHAKAVVDEANNKLTFLYEIQAGATDQSYGVHVAKLAGFPEDIVEAARRKAEQLETFAKLAEVGESAMKKARTRETELESQTHYILEAQNEDEFVRRALERLPQMEQALACGGV